jgi:SAM-dependent methyltransferase
VLLLGHAARTGRQVRVRSNEKPPQWASGRPHPHRRRSAARGAGSRPMRMLPSAASTTGTTIGCVTSCSTSSSRHRAPCSTSATDAELNRRFPGATVTGIEPVAAAAQRAQERIDRVICANAETLDFGAAGLVAGSFDLIIVADVLEHMYDPWHMLERLRPLLAPGGRILASIPNARNLWLLDKIVRGSFDYRDEGLLDITHIRFFTLAEMRAMFADTGYTIERTRLNIDGNLPERIPLGRLPSPRSFAHIVHALRTLRDRDHTNVLVSRETGRTYRIDTARLALTGLSAADLDEFFCSQIYLVTRRA